MATFIECKVKYDKVLENSMVKKVTNAYLVDALSFTEAEERLAEEVAPYVQGEYCITSMRETNISEVFFDNADSDRWYKVKALFVSLDEKKGVERKCASYMLVQAQDFAAAVDNFINGMSGTVSDYEIGSITETGIVEVFNAKKETA